MFLYVFIVSWFWCSFIDYHAVSMAQGIIVQKCPELKLIKL